CISASPSLSADGRYVVFESASDNLVAGDTNARDDIFVHDRLTGTTERVSVASDGTEANNGSNDAQISADGRFVALLASATKLVPGDTNGVFDVFVHDRLTGTTERVNVASDGTQANAAWSQSSGGFPGPALSADGRFVAFESEATNLVAGDANGAK